MLCPFKVNRHYKHGHNTCGASVTQSSIATFGECDTNECMAYVAGECLLMKPTVISCRSIEDSGSQAEQFIKDFMEE